MIVTRQLGLTVQHHMRVEEHILPLIFLVVLRCKGEVVHLLPMYYQSLVDNWSSAEAGGGVVWVGLLVGALYYISGINGCRYSLGWVGLCYMPCGRDSGWGSS